MQNWLKKIFILFSIGAAMLLFSACSGSGNFLYSDTMDIDDNFKGKRTVEVSIPLSYLGDYNGDDKETFDEIIDNAPAGLDIKVDDSGSAVKLTISIPFGNAAEYKAAVAAATKDIFKEKYGYEASVYYNKENNFFKKGLTYMENFNASDLIYWIYCKLADKGFIDTEEDPFDEIIEVQDVNLYLNQENIPVEDRMFADTVSDHYFTDVNIETKVLEDGYDVNVYLKGNSKKLSSLGKLLTAKLKTSVPDGGDIESYEDDIYRVFKISFQAVGDEDYAVKLNKVLGNRDSRVVSNTKSSTGTSGNNEGEEGADHLTATYSLSIYTDASYFIDYGDENSSMSYTLLTDPKYSMSSVGSDFGTMSEHNYSFTDTNCKVDTVIKMPDSVNAFYNYCVSITGIEVTTEYKSSKLMERDISFILSRSEADLIADQFMETLNSKASDDIIVNKLSEGGTVIFTVNLKAKDGKSLGELTNKFLGGNDSNIQASLKGGRDSGRNISSITYTFEDTINFTNIIGGSAINDGITYKFVYPSIYTPVFLGDENNFEAQSIDGNEISCVTMNKTIIVSTSGSMPNFQGIFVKYMWILSIIGTIIVLVINRRTVAAIIRNRDLISSLDVKSKAEYKRLGIYAVVIIVFLFTTVRMIFGVY